MRNIVLTMEEKKKLDKFVKEPHTMVIEYSKETKLFRISFPELPECCAKGKEINEALKNVRSAKWTWGVACIINQHKLPECKSRSLNEDYIFVKVDENDLYKINKRAWESNVPISKYVKSLIDRDLYSIEFIINPSQTQPRYGLCEFETEVNINPVIKHRSNGTLSQVAFTG